MINNQTKEPNPQIEPKVGVIDHKVSQHQPIPYDPKGVTVDKIQEFNDLHDIITNEKQN